MPLFVVGTERDHVSPWRSVYKIQSLTDTEVTFLLASGGHNAGIVAPPGREGAYFRVATRRASDPFLDPDAWLAAAPRREGSWWPEWMAWLARHSGAMRKPPALGAARRGADPLPDAPGLYVLED